jgi:C_GCAxxG_C_C family probable redox protein
MAHDIQPVRVAQRAYDLFIEEELTCSESCFQAGAEAIGIESPLVPEVAMALGGGIAATGEICGAVSGCAMVISLAAGQVEPDRPKRKQLAMSTTARLSQALASQFGGLRCRDLTGVDMRTPEGKARMREENTRETVCSPMIEAAARLLGEELAAMKAR